MTQENDRVNNFSGSVITNGYLFQSSNFFLSSALPLRHLVIVAFSTAIPTPSGLCWNYLMLVRIQIKLDTSLPIDHSLQHHQQGPSWFSFVPAYPAMSSIQSSFPTWLPSSSWLSSLSSPALSPSYCNLHPPTLQQLQLKRLQPRAPVAYRHVSVITQWIVKQAYRTSDLNKLTEL